MDVYQEFSSKIGQLSAELMGYLGKIPSGRWLRAEASLADAREILTCIIQDPSCAKKPYTQDQDWAKALDENNPATEEDFKNTMLGVLEHRVKTSVELVDLASIS